MSIRKKVLLLGGVGFFILAVVVTLVLFQHQKSQTAVSEIEIPVETEKPATDTMLRNTQSPTPEIDPARRWNTYQGQTYSFQYPKDWSLQVLELEGG